MVVLVVYVILDGLLDRVGHRTLRAIAARVRDSDIVDNLARRWPGHVLGGLDSRVYALRCYSVLTSRQRLLIAVAVDISN